MHGVSVGNGRVGRQAGGGKVRRGVERIQL